MSVRYAAYGPEAIGYGGVDTRTDEQVAAAEANAKVIQDLTAKQAKQAKILNSVARDLEWRNNVAAEQAVSLGEGIRRKSSVPRAAGGLSGGNAPNMTGCTLRQNKITNPQNIQTVGRANEGSAVRNAQQQEQREENEVIEKAPETRAELAIMGGKRAAKDTLNATLQGGLFGCATGALFGALEGAPAAGATMGLSVLGGMAIGCYSGATTGAVAGGAIGLAGSAGRGITEQALFDENKPKESYKKGSEAGKMVEQGIQTAAMIYTLYQTARQIGRGIETAKTIGKEYRSGDKTLFQSITGQMGTPMADEFFRNHPGIGYEYGPAFYGGKPEDLHRLENIMGYRRGALYSPTIGQYKNITGQTITNNELLYEGVSSGVGKPNPENMAAIGKRMKYNVRNNDGLTKGQRFLQRVDDYKSSYTTPTTKPPLPKADFDVPFYNGEASSLQKDGFRMAYNSAQNYEDDLVRRIYGSNSPTTTPVPSSAVPPELPDEMMRNNWNSFTPKNQSGYPVDDELADAIKNMSLLEKTQDEIVNIERQLAKGKMSPDTEPYFRQQLNYLKGRFSELSKNSYLQQAKDIVIKSMPDRAYMSERIKSYAPAANKHTKNFVKNWTGGAFSEEAGHWAEQFFNAASETIEVPVRPVDNTLFGKTLSDVSQLEAAQFYSPTHRDSDILDKWKTLFATTNDPQGVYNLAGDKIAAIRERAGLPRKLSQAKNDETLLAGLKALRKEFQITLPQPTPMRIDTKNLRRGSDVTPTGSRYSSTSDLSAKQLSASNVTTPTGSRYASAADLIMTDAPPPPAPPPPVPKKLAKKPSLKEALTMEEDGLTKSMTKPTTKTKKTPAPPQEKNNEGVRFQFSNLKKKNTTKFVSNAKPPQEAVIKDVIKETVSQPAEQDIIQKVWGKNQTPINSSKKIVVRRGPKPITENANKMKQKGMRKKITKAISNKLLKDRIRPTATETVPDAAMIEAPAIFRPNPPKLIGSKRRFKELDIPHVSKRKIGHKK